MSLRIVVCVLVASSAVIACGGEEPAPRSASAPIPQPGAAPDASTELVQAEAAREMSNHCAGGSNATEECASALDHACDAGIEETCKGALVVRAAAMLKRCAGPAASDDTSAACAAAAVRFDSSCSQGDKDACSFAMAIRGARAQQTTTTCDEHAVTDCKGACDSGDLDACVEVGMMYLQGSRVPRDIANGGAILQMACKKGSPRACFTHGSLLQATDPSPAAASLQRGCESNEKPWSDLSCNMLLGMLDRGSYAPPLAERRDLLRRLCDRERAQGAGTSACGRLQDLGSADSATLR